MMRKSQLLCTLCLVLSLFCGSAVANSANETHDSGRVLEAQPHGRSVTAPRRNLEGSAIDGSGTEPFKIVGDSSDEFKGRKSSTYKVAVSTVAWLTIAMAAASGLGSVPFFFVELEPQWAGLCNGMAAGVMLAASFDLVQEGQNHGSGSWVVVGILAGGVFIWLCKKVVLLRSSLMVPVAYNNVKIHLKPSSPLVECLWKHDV